MKTLTIGSRQLHVKDYECSLFGEDLYPLQKEPKLWLYVNLTDACQAGCPFCLNPSLGKPENNPFSIKKYLETLAAIIPYVSGISFTGGEPLLDLDLFREVLVKTSEIAGPYIELDTVTNGINLADLCSLKEALLLTSIHISRHSVDDDINSKILHWNAPTKEELKSIISSYPDPGAFIFNCVLQKCGVHDADTAAEYLEMAGETGVTNTSFIGMIKTSAYWDMQYVSPKTLHLDADPRFRVWNHYKDKDYCSCSTGDYRTKYGYTGYYYRWPGNVCAEYCRQLVYTADNRLLAGFGGTEIPQV